MFHVPPVHELQPPPGGWVGLGFGGPGRDDPVDEPQGYEFAASEPEAAATPAPRAPSHGGAARQSPGHNSAGREGCKGKGRGLRHFHLPHAELDLALSETQQALIDIHQQTRSLTAQSHAAEQGLWLLHADVQRLTLMHRETRVVLNQMWTALRTVLDERADAATALELSRMNGLQELLRIGTEGGAHIDDLPELDALLRAGGFRIVPVEPVVPDRSDVRPGDVDLRPDPVSANIRQMEMDRVIYEEDEVEAWREGERARVARVALMAELRETLPDARGPV